MMFLGVTFLAQFRRQLLATPAIADGDGHGALGRVLADDVAIQFLHDLPRRQFSHVQPPKDKKRITTENTEKRQKEKRDQPEHKALSFSLFDFHSYDVLVPLFCLFSVFSVFSVVILFL